MVGSVSNGGESAFKADVGASKNGTWQDSKDAAVPDAVTVEYRSKKSSRWKTEMRG